MTIVLTGSQRRLARHALGLPNKRRRSYRNRFATSAGASHAAWTEMVESGFAHVDPGDPLDLFYLTRAVAEAALDPGETLDPEDFPE